MTFFIVRLLPLAKRLQSHFKYFSNIHLIMNKKRSDISINTMIYKNKKYHEGQEKTNSLHEGFL
jgi:hypothetical protein